MGRTKNYQAHRTAITMLLSKKLLKAAAMALIIATATADSQAPRDAPRHVPSKAPSDAPSHVPSKAPSGAPSHVPSKAPSGVPSKAPSDAPSKAPSKAPSGVPSRNPSQAPTANPTSSGPRPSIVPSASPSTAPTTVLRPSQNPSRETPIQYSTSSTVGSQGRFLPADVNQCLQTVDFVRTAVDALAKKAGLEGTVQTTINSVDVTTNNNGVNQNETQTVPLSPPCQLATGTRSVGPTYLTTFNVVTKQYFGLSDAAAGSPKEQEIFQHQINLFRAAVNLATMQAVIETAELVALVGTNFELGKLEQSADVLPGQVLSVSVSPTKSRSPSASPSTAPSGGPSQSP